MRAENIFLPLLCAVLLGLLLVFQTLLASNSEVPAPEWRRGSVRSELATVAGVPLPDSLARQSIFSPLRTALVTADGLPNGLVIPLDGARVAGTVSVGRRIFAVAQWPDGRTQRVAVGSRIAGWTLAALTPAGARFRRGSDSLFLAYGAAALPQAATPQDKDSEE